MSAFYRPFHRVIAVQFVSALADNALLIVAIARLLELAAADWTIPLLKLSFTLCYVFLAPFVGPLADAWPKGRVMVAANLLKLLAACLLLGGADPLLVLAVAGLGAAVYAPAKYGLITELLPADQLVRANGYIEGSTVCAVILGTVLGGALVSPLLRDLPLPEVLIAPVGTTTSLSAGMLGLLLLYGVATALNVGIVDSGVRYPRHSRHAGHMVQRFFSENRILWRDPLGGVSMAVTTLLWGIGATLQLVVLRWAEESLGLALSQAAYLQGVTAVGVIAGATWASQTVSLAGATRLLPLGIAMGLLVPCMASVQSLGWAAGLLMLVGAMAGYFVVPMNALLQHRGHALLTAGRSIAVQGFNENAGILLMLSLYAASTALQIALHQLLWCFGGLVATAMAVITLLHYRRRLQALSSN
ncbi:lysophospholipid transporter LplT [Rhodoferax sp.]|uniref:lysophospholipid transporter LplT n=1 Tax=Rhodoferax sp. TaxID=50421 RepID=UPI00374CEEEF